MENFNSFGVMLDCSRNGVMKVSSIKRFAEIISQFGYNALGLYTEDTIKVDGEDFFGYMRGAYSVDEIKELDAFCKSKNITLYPCVQTLAHLNAIFRYSEYDKIKDIGDILLIDDDRTYILIENIFKTLRKCYSTDRINIGMDEAHLIGLGRYLDRFGYQDRTKIVLKHLNKVCSILEKYNFKPEMWSDMFFRLALGDYYKKLNKADIEKVKSLIPKNLSLVYWDYYSTDKKRYKKMIENHKLITDKIKFAGGGWSWTGFVPNNSYAINTIKSSICELISCGIKDYTLTLWGDDGKECSYFSCLPSIFYAIEYAKGNRNIKSIKERFEKIVKVPFDYFIKLDELNNLQGERGKYPVNPSKYMLYNDCFMGLYDGTAQQDEEKVYQKISRGIAKIKGKTGEFQYLFESMYYLSKSLYFKFNLGNKTKSAYDKRKKEGLKLIIKDYERAIENIEKFYKVFSELWEKECKPFGFEVHEIRLCGLIGRLKSCKKRLNDFLEGKIDRIEQLEEIRKTEYDKKSIYSNSWGEMVTPSVMSFLYCKI